MWALRGNPQNKGDAMRTSYLVSDARLRFVDLCLAAAVLGLTPILHAQAPADPPTRKVLVIGIDGLRPDALKAARSPHLDALIAQGAYTDRARVLPKRDTGADTISGPGWSSILTGVWADKHGVTDNKFKVKRYDKYPHFFRRIKESRPTVYTASIATWAPIAVHIVSHADVNASPGKSDEKTTARVTELLKEQDPTAVFVHLDEVDGAGHRNGFHPDVAPYRAAIEKVDQHVGRIVNAVKQRPTFAREDWLILVTSDHGGRGKGHSGGRTDPERLHVPLIVSGAGAKRGVIKEQAYIVDVVPTALAHLGLRPRADSGLDGSVRGLKP